MADAGQRIDALRVALEMERRGHNLYQRALQYVQDAEMTEMLRHLAADEAKHYEKFSSMMDEYGDPELSGEETLLAAAKAADIFLPGGLMQAAMDGALESQETLLDEAMQAEIDSIRYYQELLEQVDGRHQIILVDIIHEEEGHLEVLQKRKEKVREGNP